MGIMSRPRTFLIQVVVIQDLVNVNIQQEHMKIIKRDALFSIFGPSSYPKYRSRFLCAIFFHLISSKVAKETSLLCRPYSVLISCQTKLISILIITIRYRSWRWFLLRKCESLIFLRVERTFWIHHISLGYFSIQMFRLDTI